MGRDRTIIACGILKTEIEYLCRREGWDVDFVFLDSALHCDLNRLERELAHSLACASDSDRIVCYGACHPRMNRIVDLPRTVRVAGQNCVEMLLGRELFLSELEKGAFFLLEQWAVDWDHMLGATFGACSIDIMREIFKTDRTRFLAVRTPISRDYEEVATLVSKRMQVPLEWIDVSLAHLAQALRNAIETEWLDDR